MQQGQWYSMYEKRSKVRHQLNAQEIFTYVPAGFDQLDVLLPKVRHQPFQSTDRILFPLSSSDVSPESCIPIGKRCIHFEALLFCLETLKL